MKMVVVMIVVVCKLCLKLVQLNSYLIKCNSSHDANEIICFTVNVIKMRWGSLQPTDVL